ncbi:MAG: hypothetical protein D6681_21450, partial [Calditrichaeota bacterium]
MGMLLGIAAFCAAMMGGMASAQDGQLDITFGRNGLVSTDFSGNSDQGRAIMVQPDGMLVVVGFAQSGSVFDFGVVRYTSLGPRDLTFGTSGKVTTDFGISHDRAFAGALQPDGKIIAAGFATNETGGIDFALARYNSDGTLDTGFGANGLVITDIGGDDEILSVELQSDGKILVAGFSENPSTFLRDAILARYNSNGLLDGSFGTGGVVTTTFGTGDDVFTSVTVQADGNILAGGYADGPLDLDFALARFTPSGSLDATFGTGGKVLTPIDVLDDFINALAVQQDGKIVAAGYIDNNIDFKFALARYTTTGALDPTFGTGGKVVTGFASGSSEGRDVQIAISGKILVAGYIFSGTNNDFGFARYNSDGTLDATFGTGGATLADFGLGFDEAYALALQPDGKDVAAGFAFNGANFDFGVARLTSSDVPLPVTLTSFTAEVEDGAVVLRWVTESEIDNEAFLIDRRRDGEDFIRIAEIPGQGTTTHRTEYEYIDRQVIEGETYHYRLADRDFNGRITYHENILTVTVGEVDFRQRDAVAKVFRVRPNYPNPFNPETTIPFEVPSAEAEDRTILLQVFTTTGQVVKTLFDGTLSGGVYEVEWDGTGEAGQPVSSGVYVVVLRNRRLS